MPAADQPASLFSASTPVRVWDLPTRCFHWALAAAVVGLLVTGRIGGNALVWHMSLGLTVGALLLFRLSWGLVGGRWSRFTSFLYAPGAVVRYLRGQPLAHERFEVGHNPLGSFSVFAWLLLLAAQVGTGLVADDEIATTGPLNRFVSGATASLATHWHKAWGQWLIWTLAVLHVGAIAWHVRARSHDLVGPMWRGDKLLPAGTPASTDSAATRALAALLFAACGALAAWVGGLG
jgi:cytochrome b